MFKYTKKRSGFYKLVVDGVEVTNHTDPMEAVENAGAALVTKPDAVVRVIHDYELWVEWEKVPSVVSSWTASVDVDIGPGENVVLSSTSSVGLRITPREG